MTYEERIGEKPELLERMYVTSSFSIRYKSLKD